MIRLSYMARSLVVPAMWAGTIAGVPWVSVQLAMAVTGCMLWVSIRETVIATDRHAKIQMARAVDDLITEVENR